MLSGFELIGGNDIHAAFNRFSPPRLRFIRAKFGIGRDNIILVKPFRRSQ